MLLSGFTSFPALAGTERPAGGPRKCPAIRDRAEHHLLTLPPGSNDGALRPRDVMYSREPLQGVRLHVRGTRHVARRLEDGLCNPEAVMAGNDHIAKLKRNIADAETDMATEAAAAASPARGKLDIASMAKTAGQSADAFASLFKDNPLRGAAPGLARPTGGRARRPRASTIPTRSVGHRLQRTLCH